MTLTPATSASASTARAHVPTKHGGTLGVCASDDDEDGDDDIVPESDNEEGGDNPKPAPDSVPAAASMQSAAGRSGSYFPQKSLSQKAVAAKMLTGGI